MWYVNQPFEMKQIEALPGAGFTVRNTGGVVRIEKFGCGAEMRKTPDGRYQLTELPSPMKLGMFARLWDAGYQKFLLTSDGRKFPARVQELSQLRRFNEELRTVLGIPTYYNEAIGSTSHISVYDRLKGRPGDVPDETVGVKTPAEE
jgi:hypothetical protein